MKTSSGKTVLKRHCLSRTGHPIFFSHNYVGHLTAVRRELVQKAGGFRSQFDSAQDYDLFFA